jgi:hypothetical protein
VNFVAIDLNQKLSKEQREIVDKYFAGYIPHLVILDKNGRLQPVGRKGGREDLRHARQAARRSFFDPLA